MLNLLFDAKLFLAGFGVGVLTTLLVGGYAGYKVWAWEKAHAKPAS